jgi:hypothetical protein
MAITINKTLEAAIAQAKADTAELVASARKSCSNEIKEIRAGAAQIAKLTVILPPEVECTIGSGYAYQSPLVTFERAMLGQIRKVVGHLSVTAKELFHAERREIKVILKADKFPAIRFAYIRTLPPAEACTCEIVEETRPAYTYKTLVCRPVGEKKVEAVTA